MSRSTAERLTAADIRQQDPLDTDPTEVRAVRVVEPHGMEPEELIDWYHQGFGVQELVRMRGRLAELYGRLLLGGKK